MITDQNKLLEIGSCERCRQRWELATFRIFYSMQKHQGRCQSCECTMPQRIASVFDTVTPKSVAVLARRS
jgi:hypothetical protein